MPHSNEITALLRDEAYLTLCRKSPARRPKDVAANANESLKARLARIDDLADWVKAALQTRLHDYLQQASHDYCYSAKVLQAINTWEQGIKPYGDRLLAFAHELKNVLHGLGAGGNSYASFDPCTVAAARLRLSAEDLDRASLQLDDAAKNLGRATAGTLYANVRLLPPSLTGLVQWVDRLGLLSTAGALVEIQAKETEVRQLLADKLRLLHSFATAARKTVATEQRNYFEGYWNELRHHALTNYVRDHEVDEVLDEITGRYVPADQQIMPEEPVLLYA
jgi:hypothetical protein